jgi:hypothetical protein
LGVLTVQIIAAAVVNSSPIIANVYMVVAADACVCPALRGKFVSAGFPHGVFPVSELLCVSLMLRIWPKLRVYSICASSVFQVPVWRHILCWTGARPATKHDFR